VSLAVELFFKWVKQHLRIKAFFGTSENAVKTQLWIAISIYVLVAIIRKHFGWRRVFTRFYRFSASPFLKKRPFLRAFPVFDSQDDLVDCGNQLNLFDF